MSRGQTILESVVIGIPTVFIVLAAYSTFVRPRDAPASAQDIREHLATLRS